MMELTQHITPAHTAVATSNIAHAADLDAGKTEDNTNGTRVCLNGGGVHGHAQHAQRAPGGDGAVRTVLPIQKSPVRPRRAHLAPYLMFIRCNCWIVLSA